MKNEEERKTFVFDPLWADAIAELDPEMRLAAYEAITVYARVGELPDSTPPAVRALMVFISNALDKAAARYDAVVRARQEAGRRGGSRKQTEANASKSKQTEANASKSKQTEANASKSKQTEANPSIYVNDNDYVSTDVDDDIGDGGDSLSREIAELARSDVWLYEVQGQHHRTVDELRQLLPEFERQCRVSGIDAHASIRDAKSHFDNWLRKKDDIKRKEQRDERLYNGKRRDADARRGVDISTVQAKDYYQPL